MIRVISVVKRTTVALLASLVLMSGVVLGTQPASAAGPNYWTSKETLWIQYTGYIQFRPNYKTTSKSGYGLKSGKYVKQAYINYSRNGKSVIGGRKYTAIATSGSKVRSVKAKAYDDLRWGDKYKTKFNYGWIYR